MRKMKERGERGKDTDSVRKRVEWTDRKGRETES